MSTDRQMVEYMADVIEGILAAHRTPGRVVGGTLGPRVIRFDVDPAPHIRVQQFERLADDLAVGLRVPDVRVTRGLSGVVLECVNPHPRAVTFETMLDTDEPWPAGAMLLGMSPEGAVQFVRIGSPEAAHVLVAGTTGSGKSNLLRVMLLSMLLKNEPQAVRFVVFDPKRRLLPEGFTAAHVARYVSRGEEIGQALRDVVHTMEKRDERRESVPRLVVVVDELADIVMSVEGAAEQIGRLVARGREAGVHLVAATQHPSAAILGSLMRANFPLRLVGQVVSADDARVAAGRPGTHAERLGGRGDFLAVWGSERVRFQVPLMTAETMGRLARTIPQDVVARVIEAAPEPEPEPETVEVSQLDQDVEQLLARARREGHMPTSPSEAERWLFGSNRGGRFWTRTTEALQEAYRRGFDLTTEPEAALIPAVLRQIRTAIAG